MRNNNRANTRISKTEQKEQIRKELIKELLPLAKSFGLWIILVVLVAIDYTNHRWFSLIFIDLTTYLSYALSKILFIPVQFNGSGISTITTLQVNYKSIIIDGFPMIIELECSAYHAYLAIISLVIFSKWTSKQKTIITAIFVFILSIINSLRIIILGVIGHKSPQLFDLMHDYIWNILLVVVIWGLWEIVNKRIKPIGN